MNSPSSRRPDYLFFASLIIIIGVAVFLAMDRFTNSEIYDYLNDTGQRLITEIKDKKERQNLQEQYNTFLKKVEEREINPSKVEQFISKINNLSQKKEELNNDAFVYILQTNLNDVTQPDTIQQNYIINDKKWADLQQRLIEINIIETEVKDALNAKSNDTNQYTFSYTLDDTLNIILNENLKEQINKINQVELSEEIKRFEKEKILKWQKKEEIIKEDEAKLREEIAKIKATHAEVSVFSTQDDSTIVPPTPPAKVKAVPAIPE